MGWSVIVIWMELYNDAFSVPRVAHEHHWYKTKEECESYLLDSLRHFDGLTATTEPEGVVIEFPYVGGKGYRRCSRAFFPDWG